MRKSYPRAQEGLPAKREPGKSPEQGQQLELFLTAGRSRLADPLVQEKISAQLDVQDPFDAIAGATVGLIDMVTKKLVDEGAQIDPAVLLEAAGKLMIDIISLYEKKTGDTLTQDEVAQALAATIAEWIDNAIRTEQITTEELQQLSEMVTQTPEGKKIAEQIRAEQPMAGQNNAGQNRTNAGQSEDVQPGLLGG